MHKFYTLGTDYKWGSCFPSITLIASVISLPISLGLEINRCLEINEDRVFIKVHRNIKTTKSSVFACLLKNACFDQAGSLMTQHTIKHLKSIATFYWCTTPLLCSCCLFKTKLKLCPTHSNTTESHWQVFFGFFSPKKNLLHFPASFLFFYF